MAAGDANAIEIDLIGCINAGRQVLFVIKKAVDQIRTAGPS